MRPHYTGIQVLFFNTDAHKIGHVTKVECGLPTLVINTNQRILTSKNVPIKPKNVFTRNMRDVCTLKY